MRSKPHCKFPVPVNADDRVGNWVHPLPPMRSKPHCKFPVPVNADDRVGNWVTYVVAVSAGVSLGVLVMVFAIATV